MERTASAGGGRVAPHAGQGGSGSGRPTPTPTPTRDGGDADPTTRPNHMHQLTICTTACAAAGRAELTPGPDPGSGRSLRPAGGLPPANAHLPHRRRCLLLPPLSTASCGCSPGTNHSSRAGASAAPNKVRCRSLSGRCGSRPQCCPIRAVFARSAGEAIQLTCTTTADR